MALIPHKADPNYKEQMERYEKDNSSWGGDDLKKGLPEPGKLQQGQKGVEKPAGK